MNREIQLLRDVITKLVPLLTGKGLKVTQRGTQAYVQANPKTNKPEVVNIPSIPDNASDEFISAVQGFVDHEVAHVLFTDWRYYGGDGIKLDKFSPEGKALVRTHNIIEDTMIEREIVKTFPGAEINLERLHRHFLTKITTPALAAAKGKDAEEFAYLIVPMMRALSGQEIFQEFMDVNGYWKHPMIENLHLSLSSEALEMIKKARSTQDTLEVAQEVHDILFHNKKKDGSPAQKPQPKQQQKKPPQPSSSQESESQDKPDQQAGQGDGDGERKHEEDGEAGDSEDASSKASDASDDDDADEEQSGNGGGSNDEESEDESDDESSGAGSSGDESEDEDDAGEDSQGSSDEESDGEGSDEEQSGDSGDDDSEEEGDEADDVKSEDGASEEEADEAGEDDGDGEADGEDTGFEDEQEDYEDHDGNNDSSDDEQRGEGGGVGGDAAKSMFDLDPSKFEPLDLSSAMSQEIQKMAQKAVNDAPYSVFTKDEDEIKTLEVPDAVVRDDWVPKLDDAVMSMVGPMQKDIERLMAAQSLSVRTSGHKSGRLHSASLYRVMQNDPRVFQRKQEHNSKDTAVMLLVDCSGSMMGARIVTAMQSAYALAQTLERVNIASEILGFTTGSMSHTARKQAYEEYQKHRVQYSRDSHTIVMPIFKAFNERLNPTVKKRIAYQLNVQSGMNTNTDGESLEYAALRLIPRREKRKVMLVLSDGQPVGDGSGPHLKATVSNLTKMGIETVGIGIQSDIVKNFYPRHLSLNNVADLPSVVMGELKRILTN